MNIRFLLEQYLSGTLFLKLRQRGYCHRIPDAAPSHALSGVHTPHRGLTIIELELEPPVH